MLHLGSGNDAKKKKVFSNIRDNFDPNENWDMVGELGDGAFGKVNMTYSSFSCSSYVMP